MEILKLRANNLKDITCSLSDQFSIGIGGLSGSGKTTFCTTLFQESFRRIVTLLPKSEYRFLYSSCLESNYFAENISEMPLIFYLRKSGTAVNPRSTLGTHSGLFKKIRERFAREYGKAPEFFSFNNSIMWCPQCKGRGSSSGVECKTCSGSRYHKDISKFCLNIKGKSLSIVDINQMQLSDLLSPEFTNALGFNETELRIIKNLDKLGLAYLSLNRIMSTLSGGETIRVLLAEFMAVCSGTLLILDEISTGLDRVSLLNVLQTVRELGEHNQIWFIDHSDIVLNATDKNLYFGPLSGDAGGEIVETSPRPVPVIPSIPSNSSTDLSSNLENFYVFKKLEKRNICIKELQIPKNCLIAVTGESGCGKSTLLHDCVLPYLGKHYKNVSTIVIGQNRNQSITSRSTIATFLDIKKYTNKFGDDLESLSLDKVCEVARKNKHIISAIRPLVDLGLGYLSLDRKIQTLSTGEFQSIHLVSSLHMLDKHESLIVLDEPSKGLSQNILNLFMKKLREIQSAYHLTVLIIEHNEYIIKCCDCIFDFGKRKTEPVTKLSLISVKDWEKSQIPFQKDSVSVSSRITHGKTDITHITCDVDKQFWLYENAFKGGVLKNYSPTAQWIYRDYTAEEIKPIIAIDFERSLYSKHTFLFETASTINALLRTSDFPNLHLPQYDYYNPDNLCKRCRGTGIVTSFDFEKLIARADVGLWDGMLQPDVMQELKNYNYSKIKFLFSEIAKASGLHLDKPYSQMTDTERKVFLYGYWESTFYDTKKKSQRQWYGMIHLIAKYMKPSKSNWKKIINESSLEIECPICRGELLRHSTTLKIEGYSLRELFVMPLDKLPSTLLDVPQVHDFMQYLGGSISLHIDVSELPIEDQVCLKCLEVLYARLNGFQFAFKNLAPFYMRVQSILDQISKSNQVIMLDWDNLDKTKASMLQSLVDHWNIRADSYGYELPGLEKKKLMTSINLIRKKNPCPYCKGSAVLRDESIFDDVDVTETPCLSCEQTGLNETGLNTLLEGFTVKQWLFGTFETIAHNCPVELADIPLCSKIRDLNKQQLSRIQKYLEERTC